MFLRDILFPKFCLGCNALGAYICLNCEKKLKLINYDSCIYCGKKSYMGLTHFFCQKKNGIDGATSLYFYNDFMKKIIKSIKYRLATDILREFFQIKQPKISKKFFFYKQLIKNGLIQPVPLHYQRLRLRGFNQAYLISNFFNQFLQFSLVDYCIREKNSSSQASIDNQKNRKANVKDVFKCIEKTKIKNKSFLIVDDVLTTGSTVLELAKTLKKQGADKVYAITLAKG